jgi:hypothetical protein
MKYIITENRIKQIAINYLNEMYGDLERRTTEDWPGMIFFVKGKKIYMDRSINHNYLHIDYDTIWSDLENMFSLEDDEIKLIINKWMSERYNLMETKPRIRPYKFNYEYFFKD